MRMATNEVLYVIFVVFNFSLYRINRYGLLQLGQNNSEVTLLLQITAISYNVTSIYHLLPLLYGQKILLVMPEKNDQM
jgi:hypothetical protein